MDTPKDNRATLVQLLFFSKDPHHHQEQAGRLSPEVAAVAAADPLLCLPASVSGLVVRTPVAAPSLATSFFEPSTRAFNTTRSQDGSAAAFAVAAVLSSFFSSRLLAADPLRATRGFDFPLSSSPLSSSARLLAALVAFGTCGSRTDLKNLLRRL